MIYKKIAYVLIPLAVFVGMFIGGTVWIHKSIAGKSKIAPIDKNEVGMIPFTPTSDDLSKELDRLQEYEIIQDAAAAKKYAASHTCGKTSNDETRPCNSKISDPNERYYFSKSQSADEIIHVLVGDFEFKGNKKITVFSNDTLEKLKNQIPTLLGRPLGESNKFRAQVTINNHVKKTVERVAKEMDFNYFNLDEKNMLHQGIRYKLEGYIGTGVYNLNKSIPITGLVRLMVEKFVKMIKPYKAELDKVIGRKLYPWGNEKHNVNLHTLVCLASDLVGEGQLHPEQQPGIAAVFWNRMTKINDEIGGLNLDATFLYGYKNSNDYDPAKARDIEYMRKHLNWYNTYKMKIINQGAIAQISKSAWEAILKPEDRDAFFYLHDSDGKIHYAKTYAEHKANESKFGVAAISFN